VGPEPAPDDGHEEGTRIPPKPHGTVSRSEELKAVHGTLFHEPASGCLAEQLSGPLGDREIRTKHMR